MNHPAPSCIRHPLAFSRIPSPRRLLVLLFCLSSYAVYADQPLFDAHLHYNIEDAERYSTSDIIAILNANGVEHAVVTSRPPEQVQQLAQQAPQQILPLLGAYRNTAEKHTWMHDTGLPQRVEAQLADAAWRGIGELHIFAPDRHSEVFSKIIEVATRHGLPLLMHCDPAVIDTLYEHAPNATVIWAHASAYPFPPLLRDYLERHPNLHIDLSVRDGRIAPDGVLAEDWEWLLLDYSDRFLVGVDTYRTERWGEYARIVAKTRGWLAQLPGDVGKAIASENGRRLFGDASSSLPGRASSPNIAPVE